MSVLFLISADFLLDLRPPAASDKLSGTTYSIHSENSDNDHIHTESNAIKMGSREITFEWGYLYFPIKSYSR
jgi:hypothetical protein